MYPKLPPYPTPGVLQALPTEEWSSVQDIYAETLDFYLRLPSPEFSKHSIPDGDCLTYLTTYASSLQTSPRPIPKLQRYTFLLLHRFLNTTAKPPPPELLKAEFLQNICKIYPRNAKLRELLGHVAKNHGKVLDSELQRLVLEAGTTITKETDRTLQALLPLFKQFPYAAHMFVASSDFLDTLLELYSKSTTTAGGRSVILVAVHELFKSLIDRDTPNYSTFKDQVYMLVSSHKDLASDLFEKTSLFPELIDFATFESRAGILVDHIRRQFPKAPTDISSIPQSTSSGKGKAPVPAVTTTEPTIPESSVESAVLDSLVTELRSILPHISERTARHTLTSHNFDLEATMRQLLESPPPSPPPSPTPAPVEPAPPPPKSTQPRFKPVPATAQVVVRSAPAPVVGSELKDKILTLLAEDERDDTYDDADVGTPGNSDEEEESTLNEKLLLAAFSSDQSIFDRTAEVRRSKKREDLKRQLGGTWTDEMIEGWGAMLVRSGNAGDRIKGMEVASFGRGQQQELQRTSYRRGPEDEDDNAGRGGFRGRGRGEFRGGRGGRGGGGRGGPQGGQGGEGATGGQSSGGHQNQPSARARARKEQNKGAMQRRGRANKMARMGGGPAA